MKKTISFAALTLIAACGASEDHVERTPVPTVDGASSAEAAADAASSPLDSALAPDHAAPTIDGGSPDGGSRDDGRPPIEASQGGDSGAQPDVQQPPDAGAPEADGAGGTSDAGNLPDTVVVDAPRPDGASSDRSMIVDAGPDSAAVCPADAAACDAVNQAIADIRTTFPNPCAPENDRKCGGVVASRALEAGQYVVITRPLMCEGGAWTLAGFWTGTYWSPLFDCPKACGAGMLCTP